MQNNGRQRGHLKWFDLHLRYGFIIPEQGGPDAFAHEACSSAGVLAGLVKGQAVTFEAVETYKGPQAINVKADEG
jgi:CspA family cold shock protein